MEGLLLGKGAYLAVVDADLQHDIRLIPRMLEEIEDHDVVIGSRYLDQKEVPSCNQWRSRLSQMGIRMARRLAHKEVTDPMGGLYNLASVGIWWPTGCHGYWPAHWGAGWAWDGIILPTSRLRGKDETIIFSAIRGGVSMERPAVKKNMGRCRTRVPIFLDLQENAVKTSG